MTSQTTHFEKWRLVTIPYLKCNGPSGDCYSGSVPQYILPYKADRTSLGWILEMIGYIRIRFLQSKSGNPMILIPFVVVHSNIPSLTFNFHCYAWGGPPKTIQQVCLFSFHSWQVRDSCWHALTTRNTTQLAGGFIQPLGWKKYCIHQTGSCTPASDWKSAPTKTDWNFPACELNNKNGLPSISPTIILVDFLKYFTINIARVLGFILEKNIHQKSSKSHDLDLWTPHPTAKNEGFRYIHTCSDSRWHNSPLANSQIRWLNSFSEQSIKTKDIIGVALRHRSFPGGIVGILHSYPKLGHNSFLSKTWARHPW